MTARFFDGQRAVAHDVALQIAAGELVIRAADGTILARWALDRIEQRGEPATTGKAVLARKGDPARLIVEGAECIATLMQAGLPLRAASSWGARGWAVALCLLVAAAAAAVLTFGAGPRLVAGLVPAAWEDRLGRLAAENFQQNHRVCRGEAGQRALETLVGRLRAAGGIAPEIHIEVLDDPMVNALTLPGGRVLVMRGLIDKVQDGGELAGVIAHELGHVAHRDPVTLLLRQMGIGLVVASLGWNDAFADSGGIAQQLLTLSYSRQAEAAADAAGEAFLTQAGLRADGLHRFFAQLETIEGHGGGFAWLATHPPTAQRLARATQSTAGAPPLSDEEWAAVRRMCR
jgi:predicted Zn-dependent protease